MENFITLLITCFVCDISVLAILVKTFGLRPKKIELFLLLVFSVAPQLLKYFCELSVLFYVLIKLCYYLFASVFIVDVLSLKKIFSIFGFSVFLVCSVYGFGAFFALYIRSLFLVYLGKNARPILSAISIFALAAYIFLLYILFSGIAKRKKINTFLSKVSFSLFGRHIEITGLLDSGNSLRDTLTGKSVIVVPISVLRRFISESECKMIEEKRYFGLNIANEIEYETVGGKKSIMPIVDIKEAQIIRGREKTSYPCVLGIVSEDLNGGKNYECLLHREFI